jgi:hypothetical protein
MMTPPTAKAQAGLCDGVGEALDALAQALTPRQRRFAQLVAEAVPYKVAYAQAYPGTGTRHAESAGSRMMRNVKVRRYLDALRAATEEAGVLDRIEKRKLLARVVRLTWGDLLDESGMADIEKIRAIPLACIESVHVFTGKDGTRGFSIRLTNVLRAIEIDNVMAGHVGREARQNPSQDMAFFESVLAALPPVKALSS